MPKMVESSVTMWDRWHHGEIEQARALFEHEVKVASLHLPPGFQNEAAFTFDNNIKDKVFQRQTRTAAAAIVKRIDPPLLLPDALNRDESLIQQDLGRTEHTEPPVRMQPMITHTGYNVPSSQGSVQSMTEYLIHMECSRSSRCCIQA